MESDLQSLFGLHVTWCAQLFSLAEAPQLPPSPRIWTRIARALLVSKKIDDISLYPPGFLTNTSSPLFNVSYNWNLQTV